MGGYSPTTDNVVQELHGLQGAGSFGTPSFFFDGATARIYYTGVFDYSKSFTIDGGILTQDTLSTDICAGLGGTMSLSANGSNNGIAWEIDPGAGQLRAYDATNLANELWTSAQAPAGRDALAKAVSFSVPTVADSHVFVGAYNALVVYGLLSPPTTAPAAPQALTAVAASAVQIDLTWTDASDNENSFAIEMSPNGGATWSSLGSAGVNATSYSVTGLTPGTTCGFRVRSLNSAGSSDYSNVASATTIAPTPTLNFSQGFTGVSSLLSLNGGVPAVVGNNLVLTDGGANETTSVFSRSPVKVNYFTTTFTFTLSGLGEGIAFVIQNNSGGTLGSGGPGLGYGGLGFSAAVKFDLFSNSGEGSSSTGLYLNGVSPDDPAESIRMTPFGVDIRNGDVFQVTLRYDGTTLYENVVDTVSHATFTTSYPAALSSIVGGTNAFVGFTAATDSLAATQSLLSWTYTPLPAPPNTPASLTVQSASGTELDVSWSESGSTVDHFNIFRSDGISPYSLLAQVPGSQTFYADGGLTPAPLTFTRSWPAT